MNRDEIGVEDVHEMDREWFNESDIPSLHRRIAELEAENEKLRKLDIGASKVELTIIDRTDFDCDGEVVGWEGLNIALNKALDERDRLKDWNAQLCSANSNLHHALMSLYSVNDAMSEGDAEAIRADAWKTLEDNCHLADEPIPLTAEQMRDAAVGVCEKACNEAKSDRQDEASLAWILGCRIAALSTVREEEGPDGP